MELFKIKLKKDMKQAYFTNNFDIIKYYLNLFVPLVHIQTHT